ncbi:hypothetical protein INT47_008229 [Mucor saturninus]|uniref:DUF221-domain-containing protein n=1 Tax=Mucor saturninus TaxID=64648 RepID=A0A8H7R454_9FUNG|nr:hypothetical protein INT47_008229 [Mucor saturninus]
MSELDISFKKQQKLEDDVNLKAMLIQIATDIVFAICVFFLFSWLRPRHTFIYAPKAKLLKTDVQRPVTLGPGWFDWIKPLFQVKDDTLVTTIGFDAFVFIYFTRVLKRLVITITFISMFVFLPINILAAYKTGDWPPVGLEFLSITAMNYQYGKSHGKPDLRWFWSPTVATYIFSIIVIWQMIHSSKKFILFRQAYYMQQEEATRSRLPLMSPIELLQKEKQDLIGRTLLVHFDIEKAPAVTHACAQDEIVKTMVDSHSKVSCSQVIIGENNQKLTLLIQDYNRIIKKLENSLDTFLYQISKGTNPKRPQIIIGWKFVDAIDHYTERALSLYTSIKRKRQKLQPNNYGWIVYQSRSIAQQAYLSIEKSLFINKIYHQPTCESVQLAPHPDDIVWKNMQIDEQTAQLKRWFGYGLFLSINFIWSIPIAILSVLSNLVNLIRLFPQSEEVLYHYRLLTGVIQSYVTPCLMVLFYCGVPELLHFVTKQQAYKTETVIQQKTLSKLYAFFILNNLLVFTLISIMVGIVGQISALTMAGTLKDKNISQYLVQLAKNMSDVSSFWINYMCIRSVGILFELLQLTPLMWIVVFKSKGLFRYTPRQLSTMVGAPPQFKFAKSYGMVISFFTAALVFSVTAPVALPFALLYFGLATITFKYKLMYIYVTKVETHGQIWPMLYCIVMISLVVFQLMMVLILSLKSGLPQMYAIIPLIITTSFILIAYTRYLLKHNTLQAWIELNNQINQQSVLLNDLSITLKEKDAKLINLIYQDPTLTEPLWKPMVFENFESLIPDVYKNHAQKQRILEVLFGYERKKTKKMDEKLKMKTQLEKEMRMFPPTPHHHGDLCYAHYYEAGSSRDPVPLDPTADEFMVEPTAPELIQRPPPTYEDVISPHQITKERRHSYTL